MNLLISQEWMFFIVFFICIFVVAYLWSDKILSFLYDKSLGNREEIMDLMDKMFFEVDKKKVTLIMLLSSFGLGSLVFLAFWPNVLAGFFFGSVVTIGGWTIPKLVFLQMWENRCNQLVSQMVDGMTIMSNGIKAGLSITQSMERVTANIKGPLSQEFKMVLNKVRLGMTVEEALNEMGERIPRQDVQMFVTAVNILKETGGNLAETFQTITTVVRERQKVEKKIEAMTAQGLMQGVIITLVPFLLMGLFLAIDPGYIKPLFTKPLGWFALFVMLGLQVIGGISIKKIVTIKV